MASIELGWQSAGAMIFHFFREKIIFVYEVKDNGDSVGAFNGYLLVSSENTC
jgi:hypothetical protein